MAEQLNEVQPSEGVYVEYRKAKQLNDEENKAVQDIIIRTVWADNLDEEFARINEINNRYPFVAMDTEYPGVVIPSVSGDPHEYNTVKANVDRLELIQLGLTFFDEDGKLPTCETGKGCVWQFNFKEFDPDKSSFNPDSIELLKAAGINLQENHNLGVDSMRFLQLFRDRNSTLRRRMSKGQLCWVVFQGMYDFAYLVKLLSGGQPLPSTREDFLSHIKARFHRVYDIRYMTSSFDTLRGGLNGIAKKLEVKRVGNAHQAGSDGYVTASVFVKLKNDNIYFKGELKRYQGIVFGLGR